jgi:hypothetical protein
LRWREADTDDAARSSAVVAARHAGASSRSQSSPSPLGERRLVVARRVPRERHGVVVPESDGPIWVGSCPVYLLRLCGTRRMPRLRPRRRTGPPRHVGRL